MKFKYNEIRRRVTGHGESEAYAVLDCVTEGLSSIVVEVSGYGLSEENTERLGRLIEKKLNA